MTIWMHAHCGSCGAVVAWTPELERASCLSCARAETRGVDAPRDVPLPPGETYGQVAETRAVGRKHKLVPCPECGGESWLEGNGKRSCLEGHVFRTGVTA